MELTRIIRSHLTPITLALWCTVLYLAGFDYKLGEGMDGRLFYSFCHVNVFHLLANLWCVVLIARSNFRDKWWMYILSYIIACTAPEGSVPSMGLSGVVYALMGMLSWQSVSRVKFHAWCLGFISIGFFFPNSINNLLHIWCYSLGVAVGFFVYDCERRGYIA